MTEENEIPLQFWFNSSSKEALPMMVIPTKLQFYNNYMLNHH